jgi:hypothetical protein
MPGKTNEITTELDQFLNNDGYYEAEEGFTVINRKILEEWQDRFRSAIVTDIESRYENIHIDFNFSTFELFSENSQGGAPEFYHEFSIRDIITREELKAIIKTIINYNKTIIYLDSIYANVMNWTGKSKNLKSIFQKLKKADGKPGYFNRISLDEL